jgi:hypothetical protein
MRAAAVLALLLAALPCRAHEPTWVSAAGAGVIVVGAAGAVGSGMGFAYASERTDASETTRNLLLTGIAVSTGVALIGAACVLLDATLAPNEEAQPPAVDPPPGLR